MTPTPEWERDIARFAGHGLNPTYGGTPLTDAQAAAVALLKELGDVRTECEHQAREIERLTVIEVAAKAALAGWDSDDEPADWDRDVFDPLRQALSTDPGGLPSDG